jgi:hypothetical protein
MPAGASEKHAAKILSMALAGSILPQLDQAAAWRGLARITTISASAMKTIATYPAS